jgi:two-component system, chemotaxis family, response regulator WspF
MKIAIVNDLSIAVEALKRVLKSVSGHEICWTAYDGKEAVEKACNDRPDLILMDLIMPVMNGVEATKRIMKQCPCPILVVTATVTGNAGLVFDAMGAGALDAVCTPTLGTKGSVEGAKDLLKKIDTIGKLIGKEVQIKTNDFVANKPSLQVMPKMIAIGSSTGGPKALAYILSKMPKDMRASIVIVQHVDFLFANGLASWLNDQTELEVKVIKEGMYPQQGIVYLAETNDHLLLDKDRTFYYSSEPINYHYRPSVNVFYKSIKENWATRDIAVLLTGMGDDGATGMLELKNEGWKTIAQDKESSTVYGMPKQAAKIGAAQEVLPLEKIPNRILELI